MVPFTFYTPISFILSFGSYLVLKRVIPPFIQYIDSVNSDMLDDSSNIYEKHWNNNISEFERDHHAQNIISWLHAVVSSLLSVMCIVEIARNISTSYYQQEIIKGVSTPLRTAALEVTLGYFLSDTLIFCFQWKHHEFLTVLHHLIIIPSYVACIYYQCGTLSMITFQTNEITNVVLHIRYFMKQWNVTKGTAWNTLNAIFAFSFFWLRIVPDTWVFYCIITGMKKFTSPSPYWVQCLLITGGILYCLVQYAWMGLIIKMVIKTISNLYQAVMKGGKKEKTM